MNVILWGYSNTYDILNNCLLILDMEWITGKDGNEVDIGEFLVARLLLHNYISH